MKKALFIFYLFLFVYGAKAQQLNIEQNKAEIERYMDALATYGNAGQVLVASKGKIVLNKSYGLANRENSQPVTDTTIFELASVSKIFTAAAILHLETTGKLSVQDSIGKYIPKIPADKKSITIHQLLTHTSGIRGGDLITDFREISKEDLIRTILAQPLRAQPGTKWIYSNSGYNLLAHLIEKQSGMSYEAYLEKVFFGPLNMKHSGVNNTPFLLKKSVATAYQGNKNNDGPNRQTFNARTWGGGSVCSTVSDLFIWARALQEKKILSPKAIDKMFAQQVLTGTDGYTYYGYGFFVYGNPDDKKKVIDHGGETQRGSNATFRLLMDDDMVYLFVSNAQQPGGTWDRWFVDGAIKRIMLGEKAVLPPAAKTLSKKELELYAGKYIYGTAVINVSVLGNNLVLEAMGQDAVGILYDFSDQEKTIASQVEIQLKKILEDYKNITDVGLKEFLSEKGQSEFKAERDMLHEKNGVLKTYLLQGAIPDASDKNFWVCSAKLFYEKDTVDYFSMWMINEKGEINLDFGTADMASSHINKTFACTGKDLFTTFNFFSGHAGTLTFLRKGKKVNQLKGKNGLVFTRKY